MTSDSAGPSGLGDSPLRIDSLGVWAYVSGLGGQVRDAANLGANVALPAVGSIDNVVVLGMGASAVAGGIVAAYTAPAMALPVIAVGSYELPAFVGPGSLVFAISASGETEETLELADAAWSVGAQVVCITQGGALGRRGADRRAPVIHVPQSSSSRSALGSLSIPALVVLERMGLVAGVGPDIDAVVAQLTRRADQIGDGGGIAADIARRVGRTIPLVQGTSGLGAIAAWRWKTQINENAKAPAFSASIPEVFHNEMAGWGQHGDVTRQLLSVIVLHLDEGHAQLRQRIAREVELLDEVVGDVIEVAPNGDGLLARFFDLVLIGDYVSLHLAAREGVDPGPTPLLAEFKEQPAPR